MIWLPVALAAVVPAPVAIAFSPPLGRPTLFETEQTRISGADRLRFRMVNRLVFERAAGGWRLTITMVAATAVAPADIAAMYDAGMRPFLALPVVLALAPDGRPTGVVDGDAAWDRVVTGLEAVVAELTARNGGDTAVIRATKAWFDRYASLTGAARDDRLMETADELLGFDLPALAIGRDAPWSVEGAAAARIALRSADAGTAEYVVTSRTPAPAPAGAAPPPPVDDMTTMRIDRATGLLLASHSVKSAGGTPLAEENVRRLP